MDLGSVERDQVARFQKTLSYLWVSSRCFSPNRPNAMPGRARLYEVCVREAVPPHNALVPWAQDEDRSHLTRGREGLACPRSHSSVG